MTRNRGRSVWAAALWVGGLMAGAQAAQAHLRDYVLSQDYYTAKRGEFDVEVYNDVIFAEADNDDSYRTKHQVELEYGLLDHFQLAYYEVYTWDRDEDWERDEFKIEAKLRLAEAGRWPVNVALYTEYANPDGHRDVHSDEIENKLILSRDFGPVNVVGNFVFEREINHHEDWRFEYTAGVSYALTPRTRVGLEVQQSLGDESQFGFDRHRELVLAPGVYTSLTPHVRVLLAPVFGLTRESEDFALKSIVEVEF